MFFVKKRLVISGIFTFFSFIAINAQELSTEQNDAPIEYKELMVNGELIYLPIYQTYQTLNGKISEEKNTVFTVNWDNNKFNPFKNESLQYPFQLEFKDTSFSSPVDRKMVVTSRYGWRRGRPHQGIDIDLVTGDKVKTILDGKIRYVGYHGGHGRTIVVRHNNGLETVYAHLSKYLVKENDEVKKGQAIGIGGVSGNARGSHLHLEVRYHGKSIHPEYLFDFIENTKVRSDKLYVTKKWMNPRYHRSTRKSKVVVHTTLEDAEKFKEQRKKIYTVRKGDTLHRIANKHGLAVSEICKLNSIRYNSVLKIGQRILIN
ncbi:peptidoglycan DD-metalloendopeptidase family protein [Aquimarina sp. 2201CG5-10]|uniref:peptidoglycan DD-metalloendopeptidase family protein n=1 Tax=Aquimarina callyspongiae TaxID=3098150 RepID=UPI002AB3836F|nr:peptidoglycan DD-metalloendopeptidase family protein [Aquimarina sp. 2201CG5-10]MDY8135834.1 peptidoglycan DD-metalloendopeptidase family protein [Aquimarina sp. 2201CG5-10]